MPVRENLYYRGFESGAQAGIAQQKVRSSGEQAVVDFLIILRRHSRQATRRAGSFPRGNTHFAEVDGDWELDYFFSIRDHFLESNW